MKDQDYELWTLEDWRKVNPENCQTFGFDNWYQVIDTMPMEIYNLLEDEFYNN